MFLSGSLDTYMISASDSNIDIRSIYHSRQRGYLKLPPDDSPPPFQSEDYRVGYVRIELTGIVSKPLVRSYIDNTINLIINSESNYSNRGLIGMLCQSFLCDPLHCVIPRHLAL